MFTFLRSPVADRVARRLEQPPGEATLDTVAGTLTAGPVVHWIPGTTR